MACLGHGIGVCLFMTDHDHVGSLNEIQTETIWKLIKMWFESIKQTKSNYLKKFIKLNWN